MRKQFDFYGYNSPTSGSYFVNGTEYFYGEDFRNVKRYKEYKNVGFNILLLQHQNSYGGEEFATSACCKCMTEAYKAGIKRIIVSDARLKALCAEPLLVGEGGRFATQADLEEYVAFCTAPYRDVKGFYGVQLYDEPRGDMLASYGLVMRTLRKLYPSIYLQCNLLPLAGKEWLAAEANDDFEAYETYLHTYVKESGTKDILFDEYPFRRDYILGGYTLPTYQMVASVCREYGLEMRAVLQSFSFVSGGNLIHRRVTERDMLWQTNMAMGFGVKEFSFFTYFTKPSIDIGGKFESDAIDGACFINRDGSRTRLYEFTKPIIARMKRFARVLLRYEFQQEYFAFEKGKTEKDFGQTAYARTIRRDSPLAVDISYGVSLIARLKGKTDSLYMVENLGNIKDEIDGKPAATVKIDLGGRKVKAVYCNGKRIRVSVKNGGIERALRVGDALYICVKE